MNILLVDDSDFSLSLTKELILGTKIKEDINFILAKDGEEAVRIFEESKPGEISVIFMDVVNVTVTHIRNCKVYYSISSEERERTDWTIVLKSLYPDISAGRSDDSKCVIHIILPPLHVLLPVRYVRCQQNRQQPVCRS